MATKEDKKYNNAKYEELTFGIEIETVGADRKTVAYTLANMFETSPIRIGGHYDKYEVTASKGRCWSVVSDSSLSCSDSAEVVSPILKYSDIPEVVKVLNTLKDAGVYTDWSCGLHIHIGGNNESVQMLKNYINSMYTHADMLIKALQIDNERLRRYCRNFNKDFIDKINDNNNVTDTNDFEHVWYSNLSSNYESRHTHYNYSRYHLLNMHSYFNGHGTIEFRCFNGTLDEDKVISYIQFCMAFIMKAREMKRTNTKQIVSKNDKFTMRNWLRKLGLNGDEFKTCRKVFMENLEGNTQYAYTA